MSPPNVFIGDPCFQTVETWIPDQKRFGNDNFVNYLKLTPLQKQADQITVNLMTDIKSRHIGSNNSVHISDSAF